MWAWHEIGGGMFTQVIFAVILAVLAASPALAQERFSFFHPSTPESVERMLKLAELRDDDVVVSLGSGNGLIVLTAARMNARLRGRGVDINPSLVDESNHSARDQRVSDRVRFEYRNAFDDDLRDATVVTMWFFPEMMQLLRPMILERARPGTRVLASTWDMGTWPSDKIDTKGTPIHLWIVPARVGGGWHWELKLGDRAVRYAAVLEQRFQTFEGAARAADRREVIESTSLRGADIAFTLEITLDGMGLTRHEFSGKVDGDRIVGTVKLTPKEGKPRTLPWLAQKVERSDYFAPTGTKMFEQAAASR